VAQYVTHATLIFEGVEAFFGLSSHFWFLRALAEVQGEEG